MHRYVYVILFAIALASPFAIRQLFIGPVRQTASDDKTERLVIVTQHNQDIRREFAAAFDAWHRKKYGTGVSIDYRVPGGTSDIKRLLETTYQAYRDDKGQLPKDVPADIDLAWGGGDFFFDQELKPLGLLQSVNIDPKLLAEVFPQVTLAGVKLVDVNKDKDGKPLAPQWIGVCLSSFGIVYNSDLYDVLGLPEPKTWTDLTNPRLNGLIALADPAHSGSAAVAFMMVIQRAMADAEEVLLAVRPGLRSVPKADLAKNAEYQRTIARGWKMGMGQLLLIAANARYFADYASQVPNDVGNGEAAAGMAIDFYGRVFQESVGVRRCKFISPYAATAITPDPVAILLGVKGRRYELANHFIEYLLSREGQLLWILRPGQPGGPSGRSLRRPPIRPELYRDRSGWADDVDPFTEAGGFNQRADWMVLFTDTRPIWSAAWIDSRDALKDAYAAVLRVSDPARRSALIERLADLPIEMEDVAKLRIERKKIETTDNSDQWKAARRIEWARRFQEHYMNVKRDAEKD